MLEPLPYFNSLLLMNSVLTTLNSIQCYLSLTKLIAESYLSTMHLSYSLILQIKTMLYPFKKAC